MDESLRVRQERHLMRQRGAGARAIQGNFGFVFNAGPLQSPTLAASQDQQPCTTIEAKPIDVATIVTALAPRCSMPSPKENRKVLSDGEIARDPFVALAQSDIRSPDLTSTKGAPAPKRKAPRKRKALFTKKKPAGVRGTKSAVDSKVETIAVADYSDSEGKRGEEAGMSKSGGRRVSHEEEEEEEDDELSFDRIPAQSRFAEATALKKRLPKGRKQEGDSSAEQVQEGHAAKKRKIDNLSAEQSSDVLETSKTLKSSIKKNGRGLTDITTIEPKRKPASSAKTVATEAKAEVFLRVLTDKPRPKSTSRGKKSVVAVPEDGHHGPLDGPTVDHATSTPKTPAESIKGSTNIRRKAEGKDLTAANMQHEVAELDTLEDTQNARLMAEADDTCAATVTKKPATKSKKCFQIAKHVDKSELAGLAAEPLLEPPTKTNVMRTKNVVQVIAEDLSALETAVSVSLPARKGRTKKPVPAAPPQSTSTGEEKDKAATSVAEHLARPGRSEKSSRRLGNTVETNRGKRAPIDVQSEAGEEVISSAKERGSVVRRGRKNAGEVAREANDELSRPEKGADTSSAQPVPKAPGVAKKTVAKARSRKQAIAQSIGTENAGVPAGTPDDPPLIPVSMDVSQSDTEKSRKAEIGTGQSVIPEEVRTTDHIKPTTKRRRLPLSEQDANSSSPQKLASMVSPTLETTAVLKKKSKVSAKVPQVSSADIDEDLFAPMTQGTAFSSRKMTTRKPAAKSASVTRKRHTALPAQDDDLSEMFDGIAALAASS